ncbi:MAG TPA: hypothetical protein VFC99_00560 [Acidimicrobiia bacterium]|nr:hypothetical protein [Acidimicrobiia bacterium]
MRDSENPEMFPGQERKAVDGYAHRVARNSFLSDVASVAAADALSGRSGAPASEPDEGDEPSTALPRPRRRSQQHDADEDEGDEQDGGHQGPVPERDAG